MPFWHIETQPVQFMHESTWIMLRKVQVYLNSAEAYEVCKKWLKTANKSLRNKKYDYESMPINNERMSLAVPLKMFASYFVRLYRIMFVYILWKFNSICLIDDKPFRRCAKVSLCEKKNEKKFTCCSMKLKIYSLKLWFCKNFITRSLWALAFWARFENSIKVEWG